ncbi:hypothetical protein DFH06DRAFT_1151262 [Mycena polygramma]|nr:hypothetical protein DFH06DRAFT_1151262 [Mycena polygramma]
MSYNNTRRARGYRATRYRPWGSKILDQTVTTDLFRQGGFLLLDQRWSATFPITPFFASQGRPPYQIHTPHSAEDAGRTPVVAFGDEDDGEEAGEEEEDELPVLSD